MFKLTRQDIERPALPGITVDPVDLHLLSHMCHTQFREYSDGRHHYTAQSLADRSGHDPQTVQSHLKRMEESGFIQRYEVYPNLHTLGLVDSTYLFWNVASRQKKAALNQLRSFPGILEFHDYFGGFTLVRFTHQTESQRHRVESYLSDLLDSKGEYTGSGSHDPELSYEPTPLDWRILQSIRPRGLKAVGQIAEEIGVTRKTVSRRLTKLFEEKAIGIMVLLDPSRLENSVLVSYGIYSSKDVQKGVRDRTQVILGERMICSPFFRLPGGVVFKWNLMANAAEAEDIGDQIAEHEGVEKVYASILRGLHYIPHTLDDAIEAKIGETGSQDQ